MAVAAAVGAAAASAEPVSTPGIFSDVSTPALVIRDLAWLVIGICAGILLVVGGILVFSIVRFRARPGRKGQEEPEPPQVYGSARIETAWTLIPIIIVVILFLATARSILEVQMEEPPPGWLQVEAIGHQWWWEFRYPELGVVTANELHIPVSDAERSRPTFIRLESADVIHSFWVPQLNGKQDVIPGKRNGLWYNPLVPGTYVGQCAEYCGTQHAGMLLTVVVHPEGEFERWVAGQRRPAVQDPSVAAGRAIFQETACINCHSIDGTAADGTFGPDLTHLMSRRTIAAGVAPNDRENLRRWITDPDDIKPGALMPAMKLSEHEIDQVVSFLLTLR